MTDSEDEVCYCCGRINRHHSISELYLHLSYFSNMVRKFDRIYNFSVFQCTKEIKDENPAVHPEFYDGQ